MRDNPPVPVPAALRRSLGLPLLVLYGTGITIGAGIYVLIGAVAGHAGRYAPWSFLLAALAMALTVASYAELSTRYPVSAGEAAYVRAAFRSRLASTLIGLLTIVIGIVSSAAVALGSAGYIGQFIDLPQSLIVVTVILALGAVAAWGILESVLLAAVFTVIEIGGLVAIVGAAWLVDPAIVLSFPPPPPLDAAVLSGVAFASLLAFFAFIGFEDIDSLAEETKDPQRTLPRAMFATLVVSMVLYVGVTAVAVLTVEPETLAADTAPLATVFHAVTGAPGTVITAIAILATLNGVIVQIIMVARVLYGLASAKRLPGILARIHPRTGTPVVATVFATAVIVLLGLAFPIGPLAEWTSRITLSIFVVVCAALMVIKRQGTPAPAGTFIVPMWVPAIGMVLNLALLFAGG
jgi:amino acid transporter